jgi:hypothetical protein
VWGDRRALIAAGFAVAAVLGAALLLGASRPQPAHAASCSNADLTTFSSGQLTVEKSGACSDNDELFKVYCAGNVTIDYGYIATNDYFSPIDTGIPCAAVVVLIVNGLNGNDRIEVASLAADRLVNGNAGNDTLLIRNGVNDAADCGDGFDSVQADHRKLDAVNNCEVTDFAPDPPATQTKMKCKKKKHGRKATAAKKCKRRGH